MGNISDEIAANTFFSLIFGFPIIIGISIICIPFILVSVFTGISLEIIVKSVIVFGIAVFLVWLFSKHQIIENGIVGLIVGTLIYKYFSWHPVFCILAGICVIGLLFLITNLDVGFWIKTIIFSLIVTFFVFGAFYSNSGLFPASDNIWKISFFIVFLLENLYIRVGLRVI